MKPSLRGHCSARSNHNADAALRPEQTQPENGQLRYVP